MQSGKAYDMDGEQFQNTFHRTLLALFKRKVTDDGKQFTRTINLGNAVIAIGELILPSEITILATSLNNRL